MALDLRLGLVDAQEMQQMRLLVTEDRLQATLDALQSLRGAQAGARIPVMAVETSLPTSCS